MHTTFKDTVYDNLIFVLVLNSSWKLGRLLAYNGGAGAGGAVVLVADHWGR